MNTFKNIIEIKWVRNALGVIITIFLGAIGSGLWEVFLGDFFQYLLNTILRLLASIFHGYLDVLHSRIGHGPVGRTSGILFFSMMTIFLVLLFSYLIRSYLLIKKYETKCFSEEESKKLNDIPSTDKVKSLKTKYLTIIFLFAIPIAGLFFTIIAREFYTYKAATFIERSIEIVSPHCSNKKILELRASYRSIDMANKYYELENELYELANKNNISLPAFISIK